MAYRILYGKEILWDPYSDTSDAIIDASMSVNANAAKYLDFTIPPTHHLYNVVSERAENVWLYSDDKIIYKGFISKITLDMEGYKAISCTSVMDYLGDTHVRDYSTVKGEQPLTAPTSLDGLFQWYINQHNKNCMDSRKRFKVGVNQAGALDENNYVYRSSTQFPTTADEISDKILDSGGYIFERYEGNTNILDFYADAHEANTQVLDFGVNITDFTQERSVEDQYTAVYATGYTPDPPEDDKEKEMKPISLADIQNGGSPYNSDYFKLGDVLYSVSGVQRYGYREYHYSNNDITTTSYLLKMAGIVLTKLLAPTITLDVKAVDLALFMDNGYEHLQLGQAVRVRSKPHGIDEYLMISAIDLDLQDPGNTSYTIGTTYDTLTGQQSSYLKSLNSGINSSLDSVAALDKVTKENAKGIDEAKKDAANATSKANEANSKADTANEAANSAYSKANEANSKADTANEAANNANAKADEAKADAANASSKADEANTKADTATETANNASSKANTAISNSKDAADKAAAASQKADANTAKITTVENTIKTISGNTATAIANAKAAQDAADAAKQAADQAQSDASTANTEIGKVKSQVGTINTEISNIKQEATVLRDDLSGQITTVKNTMEADYTRKTELSETTNTLRNEISQSAAGVIQTVSQDYATKNELKTTTDATNKNTEDLTNAINKFNTDVDNLQGQIDGAIETWFYEVDPTDENEPAVNWNTDTLKRVHLGDLYYNTVSGYCWRYQLQNGSYSWSRITDVDVTKALADAAEAQTTANSKKRIFVTTPNPPYDVGDLWTQGSAGDIMRCQTAKTSSQSYAAADWVKASKYTDDTAVTKLSNTVEKTYSTKTEVKQLSDQVSSTVSSLETVRVSAEAAQTSANNAKKAADAAQTAADTAKANAATAQSKADEAASNLATAEQNLKTLQSQANATDEQLTAAKAEVEKAKTAAATAQGTADTAKANAATAQATADTAKANAKTAQDDVNALKNRVTSAETSIKQNSDAIALRATKTEVTSAIDGISVGGRNYYTNTGDTFSFNSHSENIIAENLDGGIIKVTKNSVDNWLSTKSIVTPNFIKAHFTSGEMIILSVDIKIDSGATGIPSIFMCTNNGYKDFIPQTLSEEWTRLSTKPFAYTDIGDEHTANTAIHFGFSGCKGVFYLKRPKVEKGNKATDWSPAPEDLVAESKTYTDAQLKISSDGITASVSSAINGLSVGGTNLLTNTGDGFKPSGGWAQSTSTWVPEGYYEYWYYNIPKTDPYYETKIGDTITISFDAEVYVPEGASTGWLTVYDSNSNSHVSIGRNTTIFPAKSIPKSTLVKVRGFVTTTLISSTYTGDNRTIELYCGYGSGRYFKISRLKIERGNKATIWSPAPEDYTTTVDMNSKIEQTANSIKSEVSEVYQPKGDYATNSSVQTAIEQSASSITSTVSKTYATKTSVDNLQNIADNAIESWYLVGVPSGTNKPASDWTTDALKKQHVGDMYYDKNTGYSYRWLQEGAAYKWIQIKDNDITTANAVANEAKSTADQAKAGVDSLTTRMTSAETKIEQNSEAISLRATKTEVTEVKNTANTAKANADTAVSTANTAKSTADAASKAASTASTNASNAVDTANNAKSTADTASETASTANTNASNAVSTANAAKSTADTVKTDLETNYSTTTQMNSAIDLKADSITSTVSQTYQPKGDYAIKSEVNQTIEGVETKITTVTNTANTAKSTADSASETASTASTNASNAVSTANTAKSTADMAAKDSAAAKTMANTANTNASNAQTTANAAKTATNTLETLIRQSGDGVEVAKKVNGEYTSTKTLMGSDGFYIKDSAGTNLTQVKSDSAIIGKESATHMQIKSDGMSIKDASNKILAGFYGNNISLNNAHFKLNTVAGDKTFSYIETDGDLCLQSNRDEAFSNRCIIRSNYIPGAGRQSNRLDLIASGSKNSSNVGLAEISITGSGTDNSSESIIEMHADHIEINSNQLSDFVIAQGTSGGWYYRQWKSGRAECWRVYNCTVNSWTAWGNIYEGYPTQQLTYPFTFKELPAITFGMVSSPNFLMGVEVGGDKGTTKKTPEFNLLRPTASNAATYKILVEAIGWWK